MFQEYYKFKFQSMKSTQESRKCYFMHDFHLFEGLIHAFNLIYFFLSLKELPINVLAMRTIWIMEEYEYNSQMQNYLSFLYLDNK